MNNTAQQKEVVALVTWLQTFPTFGAKVNGSTLESLIQSLDNVPVAR